MSRGSYAALLGLVLAGCDSRALVVGEGSATGSSGGSDRTLEPRCADAAGARVADAECWPTRHVGSWRGFVTGDARYRHVLPEPLELPSGEVLLEIDPQGTGTLAFASDAALPACSGGATSPASADAGAAGADAGDAGQVETSGSSCRTGDAGAPSAPRPGLLLDHRYLLNGLSMTGAAELERKEDPRVSFSLLIAEPWRDWCGSPPLDPGNAACSCDAGSCSVSPDTLQVSLSLSRDGLALRGTIGSSSDAGLVAGLELLRP